MNNLSTWLNSLISLIGILVTLFTSILFWEYKWQILSSVEFIIILWLVFILKQNHILIFGWTTWRVNNKSVFSKFAYRESALINKRIGQLRAGFVKLYGDEVQRVQKEFFDYLDPRSEIENTILASDVTLHPDILLTRIVYHERNKEFIASGGTIKRLFLVPDEKLFEKEFVKDFIRILQINNDAAIDIGILPFSLLKKEQIIDFIVYGNAAVLVEDMQADISYFMGRSELKFVASEVKFYTDSFKSLWSTRPFRATGIANMYRRCVQESRSLQASDLSSAKIAFFDELRAGKVTNGNTSVE